MKNLKKILPSWVEINAYVIAAFLLTIIGNVSLLATAYQFSEQQILLNSLAYKYLHNTLSAFDGLAFASGATLFIFWALVGLAILAIIGNFLNLGRNIE